MNHAEQPASSPARPRGFVYEDAPEEGGTMATRRSSHDRTP